MLGQWGQWQEARGWEEGEVRVLAPDNWPGYGSGNSSLPLSEPRLLGDGLSFQVAALAGLCALFRLEVGGEY